MRQVVVISTPQVSSTRLPRCLALFLCLGLSACGTAPPQVPGSAYPAADNAAQPYLDAEPAPLPESEFAGLFAAAEQSLLEFDWLRADRALAALRGPLNINDAVYHDYLRARIAYQRGQQDRAEAILQNLPFPGTAEALLIKVANLRSFIARLSGNYLSAAQLSDQLLRQSSYTPIHAALKRGIWRDLQHLEPAVLQKMQGSAEDPRWRGWLDLAALCAQPLPLEELLWGLRLWRDNYPWHPAAEPLPGGLEYLLPQGSSPRTIALLLPLSGRLAPAAKAVRDGFLASYYADRGTAEFPADLLVLDTEDYPSASAAYAAAVAAGSSLVIGPLSKAAVAELGGISDRAVPILALNRVDEPLAIGSSALVQLSLAPEDEADRIAELAFGRGARRALLIRPAGAWGDKMAQTLAHRWRSLGGVIAASTSYRDPANYSERIEVALAIPASEQRAQAVRDMLATNIETQARPRQDLDVVFLLSSDGAQARSIKPLLAFHYAGGLPVYATSSVSNGTADRRDRDLDGINLVDLPWLLDEENSLRSALAAGDTGVDNYPRLNALGADAYLLQQNFSRLQAGADALFRGSTGLLSMDPQLRIVREPRAATFDGGKLQAK